MKIKMFKAKKETHRFRKNQKIWIVDEMPNHCNIKFKFRGKNRYVKGVIDKWNYNGSANYNKDIGEDGFKEIDISEKFYNFLIS